MADFADDGTSRLARFVGRQLGRVYSHFEVKGRESSGRITVTRGSKKITTRRWFLSVRGQFALESKRRPHDHAKHV
jgi:hypothetical protein